MSTLKVNKLRDTAGSADAITLDPNGGAVLAGVTTVSTVKVGSGVTISSDGDVFTTGITTSSTVIVGSGVTISESGIEASGIGITCANINGTQIGGTRNIIINGAMQVAQRGTSTSSWTGIGYPACDRQKTLASYGGTWTISQSTEAPSDNGFTKSTKYDCTTANTSLSASSYLQHYYRIEGYDLQGVRKGTSGAKALTLSFWVKTNKTGTYNVEAIDQDNSRLCSFSYTVSDSNWNKYVVTFPADTTGAFGDDNGASLDLGWWLVAGTTFSSGSNQNTFGSFTQANRAPSNVNLADSTSNEWYITGIQLELGSEATAFEHRNFGEELSLCQRYYEITEGGFQGPVYGTDSDIKISIPFRVKKRASPTLATITTDENCCSSVLLETNSQDATLGARVVGNNVFLDGANRFFVAKFSADSEL